MSNIVKFPKTKRSTLTCNVNLVKEIKNKLPQYGKIKGVFLLIWGAVRFPVFLVMYWLRLPIVSLCHLLSIPMLMAWLFAWYAFPDKTSMIWGFCLVSFTAFVVAWTYDFVLMALSPQDIVRAF